MKSALSGSSNFFSQQRLRANRSPRRFLERSMNNPPVLPARAEQPAAGASSEKRSDTPLYESGNRVSLGEKDFFLSPKSYQVIVL